MGTKRLQIQEIPGWGTYLRGQWEARFTGHLSAEEKEEIYLDSFLWHVCSYQKIVCLEKQEAIQAFQDQKKEKCTFFYQFVDDACLINHAASLTMEDLPYDRLHMDFGDLYVMDWEQKWTFVMTHESSCGPYFIRL
ncbi:DUF4275 family protein [Metabacillus sp. SLBN-84]